MHMRRRVVLVITLLCLCTLARGQREAPAAVPSWSAPAFWAPSVASQGSHQPAEMQASTMALPSSPLPLVAITPCRVADTRGNGFSGQYGPPSIPTSTRDFTITGQCGIPSGAAAVSFNFTVVDMTTGGDIRTYPAGGSIPLVSTQNWISTTGAIANAAIVPIGTGGAITIKVDGTGVIDLIIDVNGYFGPTGADASVCPPDNQGNRTAVQLQACLELARASTNKTVTVQGIWTIDQQVWVPHFVTLRGLGTFHDGTKFEITYGQNLDPSSTNGTIAAIMLAKSSILDGIVIEYPNQSPPDSTMTPYAAAVGLWHDSGASPHAWGGTEILDEVRVRNCTFSGAYAGVVAVIGPNDFFNDLVIENCWWRRYYRAMVIDGCTDICKVVGVHAKSDSYTLANGDLITAGRADGLWIDRTFAFQPNRFFHAIHSTVSTIPVTGLQIRSSGADGCGTSCVRLSYAETTPELPIGVVIANSFWNLASAANTYGIWIDGIEEVMILGNEFSGGKEAVHVVNSTAVNVISNAAEHWGDGGTGYAAFNVSYTVNGNVAYNLCKRPGSGAGPCVDTTTGNTNSNVAAYGVVTP